MQHFSQIVPRVCSTSVLFIGKSKKPRCFAGINVETLLVIYQANKNAWMTSVLFEEWITNWDAALVREGRRILLLVDNCTAHPSLATLQNIRLEFYHPTQPHSSNTWIRESSKTSRLVCMTLAAIEYNLVVIASMEILIAAMSTTSSAYNTACLHDI